MKKLIILSILAINVGVFAKESSKPLGASTTYSDTTTDNKDAFMRQAERLQKIQILQGQISEEQLLRNALQSQLAGYQRDEAAVIKAYGKVHKRRHGDASMRNTAANLKPTMTTMGNLVAEAAKKLEESDKRLKTLQGELVKVQSGK